MRISSQGMGATSLAGWMRARVISFSQSPTARRFIGVFSVSDAGYWRNRIARWNVRQRKIGNFLAAGFPWIGV
jgi:hypothetical protein